MTPPTFTTQAPLAQYNVTTTVARGTRPTTMSPVYLYSAPAEFLLSGASVTVPIPTDSGVISMAVLASGPAGTALAAGDIQVIQNLPLGDVGAAYQPLLDFGFVPIVPGATSVTVSNLSGGTAWATIIFGIEG
jgi:hypothetical protein